MKTIFIFCTFFSLSAYCSGDCPDLQGVYLSAPTPYSTLQNGYAIGQAVTDGVTSYSIEQVFFDSQSKQLQQYPSVDYKADGVRHSTPNDVIPGAATKDYCSGGQFVHEEIGFLVISSSEKYYLDQNGNLVVKSGELHTYNRVQSLNK